MQPIEVTAAQRGAHVLYLTERHTGVKAALTVLASHAGDDITAIRKANGAARIDYKSGGSIHLIARPDAARGLTADIVSLTSTAHARPSVLSTVLPCMNTRDDSSLIIRPA